MKLQKCKHTGGVLPPYLWNDNKGRPGVYRYKRPDGSMKTIRKPYAQACKLAEAANKLREQSTAPSGSVRFWADRFIIWHEDQNPALRQKRGWRDRCAALRKFAGEWQHIPLRQLDVAKLAGWWEALTYDQQHNRRSLLSQFFQYAMAQGAATRNPFNNSDVDVHLIEKKKPAKMRAALSLPQFWGVYDVAPPFVRTAMILSITTTMRAGDIVALRFDHIVDGWLCRTISKSLGQRGQMAASHLKWELAKHAKLRESINEARERSLLFERCPYIVSRPVLKRRQRSGFTHPHQCAPEHISRAFAQAVRDSGVRVDNPQKPPSFHEVRGLAIHRLLLSGVGIAKVQALAAHTDQSITSAYTAGQAPEYVDAGVVVTAEVMGLEK